MDTQKKAYLHALTAIVAWSTVASAFKITLRYLDHSALLFFSSLTSLLFFSILMLVSRGGRSLIVELKKGATPRSFFLGFLNPFLYYLVLFKAYSLLPASRAMPLNYTWPIVLVLFSALFLGQRISLNSILAILISFLGVFLIASGRGENSPRTANIFGVFLALSSAFIWALYWTLNLKSKKEPALRLFLNFVYGFPFVAAYYFLAGHQLKSSAGLLGAVYVGLFEMGFTFLMWLKALRYSRTTAPVNNMVYLVPFLSLLFIHLVVGENIPASTLLGVFLIVGGIALQQRSERM